MENVIAEYKKLFDEDLAFFSRMVYDALAQDGLIELNDIVIACQWVIGRVASYRSKCSGEKVNKYTLENVMFKDFFDDVYKAYKYQSKH